MDVLIKSRSEEVPTPPCWTSHTVFQAPDAIPIGLPLTRVSNSNRSGAIKSMAPSSVDLNRVNSATAASVSELLVGSSTQMETSMMKLPLASISFSWLGVLGGEVSARGSCGGVAVSGGLE